MWHQIQGHEFATRHIRVHFQVLLQVATWPLINKRIDTSKWHDKSPLNTFAHESERTLPNDILAQGRGDYRLQLAVNFSSVFAFISRWDVHVMTLRELTGYTWKSRRVTCSPPWTMNATAYIGFDDVTSTRHFLHLHVHVLCVAKHLVIISLCNVTGASASSTFKV